MVRRYRARLAYAGSAYHGFQRQAEGIPTIQATVEKAIGQITQQVISITAAGRTDAGVHAEGQVIVFDVDWRHDDVALLNAINAVLPDDIALQELCQQAGFNPRYDARSRMYVYTVIQTALRQPLLWQRTWQIHTKLDFELMQQAASLLIGEHDFGAFGTPPQGVNTVRQVFRSEWVRHEHHYGVEMCYTVEATAFLYHMVRRMVGIQVDVGRGWLSLDDFVTVFRRADLTQAKTLAPPQGLVFANVRYDDKISGV